MKDLKYLKNLFIFLICLLFVIFFANSYQPLKNNATLVQENSELRKERLHLRMTTFRENKEVIKLKKILKNNTIINYQLEKENVILSNDMYPIYVLDIRLVHPDYTEDANIYFSIPVDHRFYEEAEIGQKLLDFYEHGSYKIGGNFADWDVFVYKKRIEYPYPTD